MTFARSVYLAFKRYSGLPTTFPATEMQVLLHPRMNINLGLYSDYSGFPILCAAFSSDESTSDLSRFWIDGCGSGPQVRDDTHAHPFLFINGGASTLSTSLGTVSIKNAVTQRLTQSLGHDGNSSLTCESQLAVLILFGDPTARPLAIVCH